MRLIATVLAAVMLVTAGAATARARMAARSAVPPDSDAPVTLPEPPIPPETPPNDALAPLPDTALTAPDRPVIANGVTLSPGLFTNRTRDLSDGYLGNSDAQAENERKHLPVPGLKLSVPIR